MDSLTMWGWIFFLGYFAFMVYMSWLGERRTSGLKDFLVAPKAYGPVIISLALGATTCSAAATMGNPGLVFSFGWPALWYGMGYGGLCVAWALTSYKLSIVGNNISSKSLPDFMGKRFDSQTLRLVTAVVTLLNVYYIAGQFSGAGWVFDKVLHVPYGIGIIGGSIFIAIYIMAGGTHADVLNCAVQGAIMLILAVMVAATALFYVGDLGTINAVLTAQNAKYSWDVVFSEPMFNAFTGPGIMLSMSLFGLQPQLSKLWFALRDERDVPKALIGGYLFMFFMGLLMWLGGIGARAITPNSRPDLAVLDMLTQCLSAPLVAVAGVGILSAIMSTLAGLMLVVAIAAANDIFRDFIVPRWMKGLQAERADRLTLITTRVMIPVVMIIGLIIAYNPPPFLTALIWVGIGAFAGGISPVLVLGCTWRRTTKRGAEAGAILGFGTYLVCYFFLGQTLGMPLFKVPWAGSTLAMIVGFTATILVSLATKPMPEELLNRLFDTHKKKTAVPAVKAVG